MKRAHFLFPLLFILLGCFAGSLTIVSCSKNDKASVSEASGKINNISVIIDDQLWNGEIGDSIRTKFASPIVGLPQEEPLYTINQYPVKLLEGFTTNSRNILIIKKEPVNNFRIVRNEFAKSQNVVHISGNTVPEILTILEKNTSEILQLMHETEIAETQKHIDTSLLDDKKIIKKFKVSLQVPSNYRYVMQKGNFMWLKKEIISGNTSVLIYSVPIKCLQKNSNAIDNIIKMRDSIGALYIHGNEPESQMITEEAYAPYLSHIKINGLKTYHTKGTWLLKDNSMSGPFINYAIIDKKNNRILVLEGFCYAPSKEKRELMHELEAIILSVEILKK